MPLGRRWASYGAKRHNIPRTCNPTSVKYKNQTLPYPGIPPYLLDQMYTRIPRPSKSLVYGCSLTDLERNATAINTQNITVRSKTFPHTPWSRNAALRNPYVILPSVLHIAWHASHTHLAAYHYPDLQKKKGTHNYTLRRCVWASIATPDIHISNPFFSL